MIIKVGPTVPTGSLGPMSYHNNLWHLSTVPMGSRADAIK